MRSSDLVVAVAAASLIAFAVPARAEALPAIGPTHPVAEESALDTILRRLKEKERTGELKRLRDEAVQRSIASIRNPAPVAGLASVQARSQRLIDPTVTYARPITADDGAIVVPAGARINPLLITRLTKRLVFFDGRDRAQANAVHAMLAAAPAGVKPILVAGSWYDTSKAWRTQVYYDQFGRLSQRFGIRAVPTVISQQGSMLLLEEVPAGELR